MFEESCYKGVSTKKSKASAENDCVGKDSHLASIHSANEMDFMVKGTTNTDGVWIGGERKENLFQWIDGTNFDYTNWDGSEPSNYSDENCILSTYIWGTGTGKWHDVPCGYKSAYVCKKSASGNLFKRLVHICVSLLPLIQYV